ncbi:MAG: DUF2251 domain-containing protein [Acidobacteria bacterium]|nr:DUF2251 domain-containing protein [Acidobacteriota bacterium]
MAKTFLPGTDTWFAVDSPTANFSAYFEDDGDTGYLYAYDLKNSDSPILDAVLIYNVKNVIDRNIESTVEVIWTADGLKAGLFLNNYLHAVIDFRDRCSYCLTGFPEPSDKWSRGPWDDSLMDLFK